MKIEKRVGDNELIVIKFKWYRIMIKHLGSMGKHFFVLIKKNFLEKEE